MITLITFAPAFGQISASPFCVKAVWMLNMSGLQWQREDSMDPRKMPKQKLPVIRVGQTLVQDSDNIQINDSEINGPVDDVYDGHVGVRVTDSSNVKIEGNFIHDVKRAGIFDNQKF